MGGTRKLPEELLGFYDFYKVYKLDNINTSLKFIKIIISKNGFINVNLFMLHL